MKKGIAILVCLLLAASLFAGGSSSSSTPAPAAAPSSGEFPFAYNNTARAITGGTLNVALVASDPFRGILSTVFYSDNKDAQILGWFDEGMVSFDKDFVMDQDGACTYTYDQRARTITFTMKPNIKWSDGQPVTLDDLLFAYEVICHPDYDGPRYNEDFENIVGAVAYHEGRASTISGIELSANKMQMTIHYENFKPTILVGGVWSAAMPRHYWTGIAVKDMQASDKMRVNPIGFGPFIVRTVVPGEAVMLVRNDNYWRGKPKLDAVNIRVIAPEVVPQAMQAGLYDIAEFSVQDYPDYLNPTNYTYLGELATVFSYTGFDLGDYDDVRETNVADPNKKMANKSLRQAMGYAVDNATLGETLYNGLRVLATTAITPRHGGYQNKDIVGYNYDPAKSRQLLDAAGYRDINNDGYREDPQGNPLTIYWAMMDGQGADTIAQFKIQCWKDVGLRVELFNGRLLDMNTFYDYVEYDEPGIDIFDGAWQTGFDPDPSGLWGDHSWNFPHYTTPALMKAMEDCASEEAWDDTFRTNAYKTWQQLFFEEATAIPTLWRTEITAVNNRVKNYDLSSPDIDMKLHLIELTDNNPIRR